MTSNLITLADGVEMTRLFRAKKEKILDPEFRNIGILPTCETFDKSAFELLCKLESCKGIRIYCGMDSDFRVKMVICGVDADDNDIYLNVPDSEDQKVIDSGVRCPAFCPPASALNS